MHKLDFYPASPVPADRYLWRDELPFTGFGQYGAGKIDLRVFDQAVWWVDYNGNSHLLREMSREYLFNVREHLLRNGESFFEATLVRYSIERQLAALAEHFPEQAPEERDDYKRFISERAPLAGSWRQWLRGTVLYEAIEELLNPSGSTL